MNDSAPRGLDALEQSCVRPGHWLIEGRTVTRKRTYGRRGPYFWEITLFEEKPVQRATLAECREYIATECEQGR